MYISKESGMRDENRMQCESTYDLLEYSVLDKI